MHTFGRTLLSEFYSTPWAILPAKLEALQAVVLRHAAGERLSAEEITAATGQKPTPRTAGAVAVLPLFGTIFPRANLVENSSGGTSAERFSALFSQALNTQDISAIVIDVDSPGGAVQGVEGVSKQIHAARGVKPVIAVVNHLAASAAYWMISGADEIVMTPDAEAGSIGVFAVHEDVSGLLEKEGVKVNFISAGKYKVEGNPYEPLTDEARAVIQARVDEHYGVFTKAVARGRGVSAADVRGGFGEGRVVGAKEAVRLGMADRIATLDEVIAGLMKGRQPRRSAQAELEFRERRARALSL